LLQEINNFLSFNKSQQQPEKGKINSIDAKLNAFSRMDNFYEVVYDAIINNQLNSEQLILVTLLLKNKFQFHFEQIDDTNIENLETLLKTIIKKYSVKPQFTFTTNICIGMICLYLKRAEKLQKTFQHEGMIKYFASFVEGEGVSTDYFYRAI
jgi:hypothetical protein